MSLKFETLEQWGIITLDAEKSLNALSLTMIESLYSQLQSWESDPSIMCVLIKGAGRAFCAGGDIRALYQSMTNKDTLVQEFFEKEYRLDAYLYRFSKPLVVWAHGVCMGGGMGIFQGASFRIATESTRLAMPEITIGLIPDVGASHFLKRVPMNWGLFLALSGARLKGAEACQLGLADYAVTDATLETFLKFIKETHTPIQLEWHRKLKDFFVQHEMIAEDGDALSHSDFVEKLLENHTAPSLMKWASSYIPQDTWEKLIIENIQKACPTSIALIFEIWKRHKTLSLEESFYNEWIIASNCGIRGDFQEGVRALLIEKDNSPKWNPASIEGVTPEIINSHFVSPRADKSNPLEDLLKELS